MNRTYTLRACGALFRVRLAEAVQYRAAAFSGVIVGFVWGLIECVIYTVFYRYSELPGNAGGFTLTHAISYAWLTQSLYGLIQLAPDEDIRKMIISGDVGVELCRPLDLYWHWFARSAAGRIGMGWIRLVITLLLAFLLPAPLTLAAPPSLASLLLALTAAVLGLLLAAAFSMLMTAVRLNITWGDGPLYIIQLFGLVLSGSYLPLRLWPDSLQGLLRALPFAGIVDTPAQLYLGTITPADALPSLLLSLGWSVALVALGRLVLHRRLKTLIVQGG